MRVKWKAGNINRQKELLIKLSKGDRSFTELYESLKNSWARETLNVYLKDLVRKHYIRKVPRGKRNIYSLERDHPDVKELLERVDIRELYKIKSERELIDDWIESMKFSLLNLIQCYMQIGEGVKTLTSRGNGAAAIPIENVLGNYLSDLVEICKYYGEFLAEEIKIGDLDPKMVWEARNELLEGIKRRRSIK